MTTQATQQIPQYKNCPWCGRQMYLRTRNHKSGITDRYICCEGDRCGYTERITKPQSEEISNGN